MKFVNLTPHAIVLNDGRTFEPSGVIARVAASFAEAGPDLFTQVFGDVENLPAPVEGTKLIVSGLVKAAVPDRDDVVAPATGHPNTVREQGRIVSVPGFVC